MCVCVCVCVSLFKKKKKAAESEKREGGRVGAGVCPALFLIKLQDQCSFSELYSIYKPELIHY